MVNPVPAHIGTGAADGRLSFKIHLHWLLSVLLLQSQTAPLLLSNPFNQSCPCCRDPCPAPFTTYLGFFECSVDILDLCQIQIEWNSTLYRVVHHVVYYLLLTLNLELRLWGIGGYYAKKVYVNMSIKVVCNLTERILVRIDRSFWFWANWTCRLSVNRDNHCFQHLSPRMSCQRVACRNRFFHCRFRFFALICVRKTKGEMAL